ESGAPRGGGGAGAPVALLDGELPGLDRLAVEGDLDVVGAHRPALVVLDIEAGGVGAGELQRLTALVEQLAILEGPAHADGGGGWGVGIADGGDGDVDRLVVRGERGLRRGDGAVVVDLGSQLYLGDGRRRRGDGAVVVDLGSQLDLGDGDVGGVGAEVIAGVRRRIGGHARRRLEGIGARRRAVGGGIHARVAVAGRQGDGTGQQGRSEEHTSELQSRENLVCRLLLEKKNYIHRQQ